MDSENHKQTARSCGSDASACSPSSTPETDAVDSIIRRSKSHVPYAIMIGHAMKMEAERNELRCEVVTLTVALKDIIAGNHGAMVRARRILSENVQVEGPADSATPQTEKGN